ncbi:extracellular solute-binding protein [Marinilactibacillus sp. Marseille-P9653]|uniref:extracellular solute-binding protein n=1 Tax=Marinilactibacillus sp. Marseille-P9653 TaxID=2866583 RepID=UPI001CE3EBD6|nr:extracellular solute-binding protein [Marinilactibacillus sp. Marseille-P9653]
MKLNKKMLLGTASLSLGLLAGCGNDNEIVLWTPLTGEDGQVMDEMIQEYNDTDPEFPVSQVITPDLYTQIYTVMNTGEGTPDLSIIHADRVQGFVELDMLEPFDELMSIQDVLSSENYIDQAWDAGTVNDSQYTIPLDIHSNVLYYNEDLLAQYGAESFLDDDVLTFDEIMSLEGQLDEGVYAINNALISWVLLAETVNLGGDISDADGNPTINTPEMQEAMEALVQVEQAGLMTPNGEDGFAMFQGQSVLFSSDGTWSSLAHDMVEDLNYGITNIYAFDNETFHNRGSAHLFSMLTSESRSDEKEQGIADFLAWVNQNSITWAEAGQIVASRDVYESEEFQTYPQSFFTKSQEQLDSLLIFDYEYYGYVEAAINTVINDMLYGGITVEDGLAAAQNEVEDLVAQGHGADINIEAEEE